MEAVFAVVVGVLYAGGVYLVLRPSLLRIILGLALLSHGANLLIFVSAGLLRARPPLLGQNDGAPFADPVPQALVLTAIVIGFGVIAFALVLFQRAQRCLGSDDPTGLGEGAP
jgi:multicomponent Na+:H+ antiporter subunit C